MEDEKSSGLSPRTFGAVIAVVVFAAIAMFVGLYLMGAKQTNSFNDGYDSYYDPTSMGEMPTGPGGDYDMMGEYPEGEINYGADYTEFYPYEADGFYYESTSTVEGEVQYDDGFYPME